MPWGMQRGCIISNACCCKIFWSSRATWAQADISGAIWEFPGLLCQPRGQYSCFLFHPNSTYLTSSWTWTDDWSLLIPSLLQTWMRGLLHWRRRLAWCRRLHQSFQYSGTRRLFWRGCLNPLHSHRCDNLRISTLNFLPLIVHIAFWKCSLNSCYFLFSTFAGP